MLVLKAREVLSIKGRLALKKRTAIAEVKNFWKHLAFKIKSNYKSSSTKIKIFPPTD